MKPPTNLRRSFARIAFLYAMALATGLCLLTPAAASAHRGAHLESGVSSTGPLQEATFAPATESGAEPETSTATGTESSTETRRHERRARRDDAQAGAACSVSLQATPSTIAPGTSLSLTGTLSCPEGTGTAGQTVTLYRKVVHTPGFSVVVTATTEASGGFQFSTSEVEADSVFYVRCDGVKSARAKVKVATLQVDIETPTTGTQLFIGAGHAASDRKAGDSAAGESAVTFSGTVSPADPDARVVLQREYRKERWHQIAVGQVGDEGKYSIVHTFFRPGEANLRVVVRSRGLTPAVSAPVTYQISRRHRITRGQRSPAP